MNLPNVVAVGLVAFAIGTLSFGVVLSATPLFMDVERVLDESVKMGSPPMPEQQKALLTTIPWLTSVAILCFFAFPAALLGAAGLGVWRLVGRRRVVAMAEAASQQLVLERSLQDGFESGIQRVLAPDSQEAEALLLRYQRMLLTLDSSRQKRLLLFGRALELSGIEGLSSSRTEDVPRPSTQRVLLGRIVALFCFLVTSLVALWPITMILIAPVMRELFRATLGMELTPEDLVVSVAMLLGFGSIPLVFGSGMLLLSRVENRLLDRWQRYRREAESLLQEAFQRQAHRLQEEALRLESGCQQCRLALHAVILANFHEISERGHRALAQVLREEGLGTFTPPLPEAQT